MKHKPKILVVVGTRPETIKMAPVVHALQDYHRELNVALCLSGQHDSMAQQSLELFNLTPNYTLQYERQVGDLNELTALLLPKINEVLLKFNPDLVLVHGDTTTAFVTALSAFYRKISVGHVEAGLRTSRFEYPYPEELNRRLIARIARFHFAPTNRAVANLRNESVSGKIYAVGNTVVDALQWVMGETPPDLYYAMKEWLDGKKLVLVTCHRRENWKEPLFHLCDTILTLVDKNPDTKVIWPVHGNPEISKVVYGSKLQHHDNIMLADPLRYDEFVHLLAAASLVITDSGGIMEEAAVLGKPTLVLRDETERPEALEISSVRLVGYDFKQLLDISAKWLNQPPVKEQSTAFGDGQAGQEIADIIINIYTKRGQHEKV